MGGADDESEELDDEDYEAMLMCKGRVGMGLAKNAKSVASATLHVKTADELRDAAQSSSSKLAPARWDEDEYDDDYDEFGDEHVGDFEVTEQSNETELTTLAEQAIYARLCGDMEKYVELRKQLDAENGTLETAGPATEAAASAGGKDGKSGNGGKDGKSGKDGKDAKGGKGRSGMPIGEKGSQKGRDDKGRDDKGGPRGVCGDYKRGNCTREFCRFVHGNDPSMGASEAAASAGGKDVKSGKGGKDGKSGDSSAAALPDMSDLEKIGVPTAGVVNATVQDLDVKVLDSTGAVVTAPKRYASFEDVPFPESIKADLAKAGFPAPSQIQQYTWPLAVLQRDVIGVAATGSGKTLGFLLPAFAFIVENRIQDKAPTLLVLAPTRELAVQIDAESKKFCTTSGLRTTCCYGGAPKHGQAADIRAGVNGVIGTPGRVNDFLESRQLVLDKVAKLVLDEADRMLDMGFEPQIRKILQHVPQKRQTLFFTATWPQSVRRLAGEFLNQPWQVQIGNRSELKGNQDITQMVKPCTSGNKNQILSAILKQSGVADKTNLAAKGLVFCSTKRMCDQLAEYLQRSGVPCSAVHGDKDQRQREQSLHELKVGHLKLVVATDVAARGLDIKGITLVINYDPPNSTEDYVHRIGRTGRAGQKGCAVLLVSERDAYCLRGILPVMRRTNQDISTEVEAMARNAGPPPRKGDKGDRKGGGKGDKRGKGDKGGKRDRSRSPERKPLTAAAAAALAAFNDMGASDDEDDSVIKFEGSKRPADVSSEAGPPEPRQSVPVVSPEPRQTVPKVPVVSPEPRQTLPKAEAPPATLTTMPTGRRVVPQPSMMPSASKRPLPPVQKAASQPAAKTPRVVEYVD